MVLVLPAGVLRALINAETVHASKQQSRKTGLFQAVVVCITFLSHLKGSGVNQFLQRSKGSKKF
jgi:hypothetical protein